MHGTADTAAGYRVDIGAIVIRNLNDLNGYCLPIVTSTPNGAASQSFSVMLPTTINGSPAQAPVTGTLYFRYDSDGNVISVDVTLDSLTIPLQVDIPFEKIPLPTTTPTTPTTPGGTTTPTTPTTPGGTTTPTAPTTPGGTTTPTTPTAPGSNTTPSAKPNGPKTGDNAALMLYVLLAAVSAVALGAGCWPILKNRRKHSSMSSDNK